METTSASTISSDRDQNEKARSKTGYNPLFPTLVSSVLLFIRIFIGILMLTHAIEKITHFGALMESFPDPLGLGSGLSLFLVTFAETVGSCFIILGIYTRLSTLPLLFEMGVAVFSVHAQDPFPQQELPILYIGFYLILLVLGGGRFGFGRFIAAGIAKEREAKKAAKMAAKTSLSTQQETASATSQKSSSGISLFEERNESGAPTSEESEESLSSESYGKE